MNAFVIGKKKFKSSKSGLDCHILVLAYPYVRPGCDGFESKEKFCSEKIFSKCDLFYSYDFSVSLDGFLTDAVGPTGEMSIDSL